MEAQSQILWGRPWSEIESLRDEFLEYHRRARMRRRMDDYVTLGGVGNGRIAYVPDTLWMHQWEEKITFSFIGVKFFYDINKDAVRVTKKQVVERFVIKKAAKGRWRMYRVRRLSDGRQAWWDQSNRPEEWVHFLTEVTQTLYERAENAVVMNDQTLLMRNTMLDQVVSFMQARGVAMEELDPQDHSFYFINDMRTIMFPLLRDTNRMMAGGLDYMAYGALLREHSPRAALQMILGKRAVTKPLVRRWQVLLGEDPIKAFDHLSGLRFWRDYLTREQLVQLLDLQCGIPGYDQYHIRYGRAKRNDAAFYRDTMDTFIQDMFTRYGRNRIMLMNMEDQPRTHYMLMDTHRTMVYDRREVEYAFPERPTTWAEVHDLILEQVPQAQQRYQPGSYTPRIIPEEVPLELYKAVHNTVVGDMTIVAPERTTDLVAWSEIMGNCIRSYRDRCAEGTGLYVAVMRNGHMYANIEVMPDGDRPGHIKQLLGKHNRELPASEISALMEHFEALGWATGGRFWGDTRHNIPRGEVF